MESCPRRARVTRYGGAPRNNRLREPSARSPDIPRVAVFRPAEVGGDRCGALGRSKKDGRAQAGAFRLAPGLGEADARSTTPITAHARLAPCAAPRTWKRM